MTTTHKHWTSITLFLSRAVLGLLALATFATGCAASRQVIVDGRPVPRVRLGYTDGKYYALTHADAYPVARGPSSGLRADDGSLFGRVCGADLYFTSSFSRRKLELNGFVRPSVSERRIPERPAWIRVRDVAKNGRAEREFSGTFGPNNGVTSLNPRFASTILRGFAGTNPWLTGAILSSVAGLATAQNPVLDLYISPERLHGRVAFRDYQLTATEDDSYVGEMETGGKKFRFIVFGKSALWSMPPADQAAILPLMLSCARVVQDELGEPILFVDFSGKAAGPKG
jgi:hypothetical protein